MASIWHWWRRVFRGSLAHSHWVEPGNEITRAVLGTRGFAVLPEGPLYSRDPRDLVFTGGSFAAPAMPIEDALPAANPAPKKAARRAGRAA